MQKKYRLKGQRVFNYLYKKGTSVHTKQLVLIYANSKYPMRVGFVVSKKIGKAVVRNKVRRRLKEAFRSMILDIKDNYNYVIIAKSGIENLDFNEIKNTLIKALTKASMFKEDNK